MFLSKVKCVLYNFILRQSAGLTSKQLFQCKATYLKPSLFCPHPIDKMPECSTCLINFPRLTATKCTKCTSKTPGMIQSEISVIEVSDHAVGIKGFSSLPLWVQNKPQCAGCGLVSGRFINPICPACIMHYSKYRTQ